MTGLYFHLRRRHVVGQEQMYWYYYNSNDMTVSSGFRTREVAYEWVRTQVAPKNRHYYEYEDPLVVWYKKGIKELSKKDTPIMLAPAS
jgi:hypothetical protein